MKMIVELEKEYQDFMIKVSKAAKDVNDDFNKLSAQNQQRFKQEVYNNLPAELLILIQNLKK